MAVSRGANVIRVSGDGSYDLGNVQVCSIKYIGTSAGAVDIWDSDSNGTQLYEADGPTDTTEDVYIRATNNARIEITSNAICYLYTK